MKSVLHYIGLLLLFVVNLLGALLCKGSELLLFYIFGAVVLVFALYYLVNLMTKKRKQTHVNYFHVIVLWVLYLSFSYLGSFFAVHFISITHNNTDLQNNGNEKLQATIDMRKEFRESVSDVEHDLEITLSTCLSEYYNASDNSTLKQRRKDELVNFYSFTPKQLQSLKQRNIDRNAANWVNRNITGLIYDLENGGMTITKEMENTYAQYKDVFANSDYLLMNQVYFDLDTVLIDNKKKLEDKFNSVISQYDDQAIAFPDFALPKSTFKLNDLEGLKQLYSPLVYILIYIIIHLFILWPFLLERKRGFKPNSSQDTAKKL